MYYEGVNEIYRHANFGPNIYCLANNEDQCHRLAN